MKPPRARRPARSQEPGARQASCTAASNRVHAEPPIWDGPSPKLGLAEQGVDVDGQQAVREDGGHEVDDSGLEQARVPGGQEVRRVEADR